MQRNIYPQSISTIEKDGMKCKSIPSFSIVIYTLYGFPKHIVGHFVERLALYPALFPFYAICFRGSYKYRRYLAGSQPCQTL